MTRTATVLHQGDPVPGGNGIFGNIAVPVFLNNKGQIAFSAPLEDTTEVNDVSGIFFIGSDGVVQTVARYGMPLAGSTILSAFFLGDLVDVFGFVNSEPGRLDKSDLHQAGMSVINDSGQVPFWASLADGRSGIFLWNSSTEPPDDDIVYAVGFE